MRRFVVGHLPLCLFWLEPCNLNSGIMFLLAWLQERGNLDRDDEVVVLFTLCFHYNLILLIVWILRISLALMLLSDILLTNLIATLSVVICAGCLLWWWLCSGSHIIPQTQWWSREVSQFIITRNRTCFQLLIDLSPVRNFFTFTHPHPFFGLLLIKNVHILW